MSALKALGLGIVTLLLAAIVAILLTAVVSAIGGIVGAGIAYGYNVVLGTSFSISKAALVGSIVFVLSGTAGAAALTDD